MKYGYSDRKNIQVLISLLKAYGVRKIIASPGSTHLNFLASCQQDDFFEIYSEIDERNAAYMACGLAAETGEPIIITCTGATASRDYLPGLTEAFHRKLPVLAITGTQDISVAGNLSPQFIDRSAPPPEAVRFSVHVQTIKDAEDAWAVNLKINKALSELTRHGGGPVHINLTTEYARDQFGVFELPKERVIRRYFLWSELPAIPDGCRIAVTVGAHKQWPVSLTEAVDRFCAAYDAIVLVDHSSGYFGKYRVLATLAAAQEQYRSPIFDGIDLLIHIGEESGDYYTYGHLPKAKEVWRVSEDGEMRDTFHKLTCVFEMPEESFFRLYTPSGEYAEDSFYRSATTEIKGLYERIPELPLSNIWLAKKIAPALPEGSVLHIGVSNTMRSWTFFDIRGCKLVWANTGCRGIDGVMPTALGMSFAEKEVIHYCVLGDLTFFYGLNSLGNREIKNNLRILLINNGKGSEFRIYQHKAQQAFGDDADPYIAAAGHFGGQSRILLRSFVNELGFDYYSVETKEDFGEVSNIFLGEEKTDRPILVEVFTECSDESEALRIIRNLVEDKKPEGPGKKGIVRAAKNGIKSVIGEEKARKLKELLT